MFDDGGNWRIMYRMPTSDLIYPVVGEDHSSRADSARSLHDIPPKVTDRLINLGNKVFRLESAPIARRYGVKQVRVREPFNYATPSAQGVFNVVVDTGDHRELPFNEAGRICRWDNEVISGHGVPVRWPVRNVAVGLCSPLLKANHQAATLNAART